MKVAIIGYGSLVRNLKDLPVEMDIFNENGPELPLEFSRISKDGRLTLVIDEKRGTQNKTFYTVSRQNNLEKAVEDLRKREKLYTSDFIGWVNNTNRTNSIKSSRHPNIVSKIIEWNNQNNFDAAIWTDLGPRFKNITGIKYSNDAAWEYLLNLPVKRFVKALDYIRSTPVQIKTSFLNSFNERLKDEEPIEEEIIEEIVL